ncbi:MAG: hypothetical protein KJ954_14215 [Alphaproteobacteria bacterium]|nr:hypothetical protein [Alphaproteobacteria bacterium]
MFVLFIGATMLGMSLRTPMWMDEYCFYRLSLGLPGYSATSDWFFKDRLATLSPSIDWSKTGFDRDETFKLVYDTPVYPHTPLVPILMSPIVKGLNLLADYNIIPHIEDELGYTYAATQDMDEFLRLRAEVITNVLRAITITTIMVSLYLIYKIMEKKIGKDALFFGLPVAASVMMLYGAFLIYWDVFMMFFFVLTLYMMECKPESKWKYVTACCLVNTKMFLGVAFLFPLFVQQFQNDIKTGWKWPLPGWKMALPILSLIPFYVYSLFIVGDPLFFWNHYTAQIPLHDFIYTINSFDGYLKLLVNLGVPFYLPMTVPILWYSKKYPAYATFWVMSMVYAWATGLGITHTSTMIYSGALVFPLVAYEWNLMEKFRVVAAKINGGLKKVGLA